MSPSLHTDVTEVTLSPPGGGSGRNSEGSDGSIGYTGNLGQTNGSSNNSGRNVRRFPFLFYCFCFILSFLVLYCLILSYRFFRVFLPMPQRVAGTSAQEFRPLFRTRDGPLSTPLACPCEPPKLSSTLLKSSTVPLLHCAKCSSELRV